MLKRFIVCSLTTLIPAVVVFVQSGATHVMGAVPAVKSDIETIAGVVTKVDASAIEVGTDNNETTSVMVDASTLYRKWILTKPWQQDPRANADDVQVGMRVRIDVARDNPRMAETVWLVFGRVGYPDPPLIY